MIGHAYFAVRKGRYGGVDVVGFFEAPASSVLAGQLVRYFVSNYPDEATARAHHPDCVEAWDSELTGPRVSLDHLPGEDDPVPGGMYPDDIGEWPPEP
jgi:hypothetical protein